MIPDRTRNGSVGIIVEIQQSMILYRSDEADNRYHRNRAMPGTQKNLNVRECKWGGLHCMLTLFWTDQDEREAD